MRHHAGATNRTWLIIIGVLLLAAGVFALLMSSGFLNQMTGGAVSRASGPVLQESPETLLAPRWMPAAVLIGGLILGILGLWWILAEIPRKREAGAYRLQEDPARGITRCDPGVLAAAVEDDAKRMPGVVDSSALLRGRAEAPDLALQVSVNERSDIQESLRRIRAEVLPNLSHALEAPLHTVGIQLEVSSKPARLGSTVESTGTVVY
jgi:hypothetical protein